MKSLAILGRATAALLLSACGEGNDGAGRVVLYTSLNEPTARSAISVFEERTGLEVEVVADTERDKTVGLVRTLLEERDRPRADVFWNSEAAHTVRLAREGVLEALSPPPAEAAGIPARYRDPAGVWFGFAGRARVLIVNTELVPAAERPTSMWDLIDPKWAGRGAIVRPVTGTTLTHLTALYDVLGDREMERFLTGIVENRCHLPPGNGRVARLVGEGQVAFGFTDSSDYRLVKAEGFPVDAIYPDQDTIGTLLLPNTVARVRGGPNPDGARKLISFLISAESERILANHARGHIPLRLGVEKPADVRVPGEFRTMDVDLQRVGNAVEGRLVEFDKRFP